MEVARIGNTHIGTGARRERQASAQLLRVTGCLGVGSHRRRRRKRGEVAVIAAGFVDVGFPPESESHLGVPNTRHPR